ncbi:hypothetical protein F6Q07_10125 [Pectobacterium parmentieri]|uniref:hypothetical protein n=1 Tax=Pectobacterium parmentieri TaxID=1905730 RepID=UPI000EAFF3E9|nr:hypothetical protein [Pectobacterium parmentieri]AYH03420.1 hypothetical protein C5E26_22175 [Pectobacterium parmentieri]AYH29677.1 hypothetical protein C5E20_22520 [Pectobacterium parmentieri]AYH34095.1 hypothetical protein C5E19_22155 [Pectobacterium parmentieri]MBI0518491.1 hypothetical protein [Pectobacterium parmentieri]
MIKLTKTELRNLSLSDYSVSSMTLSEDRKTIVLHTDGATLFSVRAVKDIFRYCELIIVSTNEIKISRYYHEEEKWVNNIVGEILKDVCELLIDDDIFLRGFGLTTGMWLEVKISNPTEVTAILN